MKETELKPCPFCGGEAEMIKHSFWNERKHSYSDRTYSIKCCGCSVETYPFYDTKEKATESWNRRANNEQREAEKT